MRSTPPKVGDRRGGGWKVPAAVAVVIVVVAASGVVLLWYHSASPPVRGGGGDFNEPVEILPSPGTASSCIIDTLGLPRPVLPLDAGVLQGNTYNVPSGTAGHVGMCYSAPSGSMFAYANWSHVGAGGGWFSYPSVAYGVNSWAYTASGTPVYTGQGPAFALPQLVASVVNESLWTTVNYTFHPPGPLDTDGYDFSLDNFFTDGVPTEYASGPFVEVMVWFAHHVTYPNEFLPWSAPTMVGPTVSVQPWSVGYWCHGADNGSSPYVSFDYSYDGQATDGLNAGTIAVNLSLVLANVEALMPSVSCWTGPTHGFSQFYMAQENLGSEDGAVGNASFSYNWTVNQLCLHAGVTSPAVAGLSCPSSPTESSGIDPPVAGGPAWVAGSRTGSSMAPSSPFGPPQGRTADRVQFR